MMVLNELQKSLLDMFMWFHDFCEHHGLRYYVVGGTMLGAVRHNGFIPWDDDVDVGMPRADYEKLDQLLRSNPNERYVLETPQSEAPDFFYPYSKIYDTQTTLIENTRMKIKRGVYLDVFPLDGIGKTLKHSKRNYRPIHLKRLFLTMRATCLEKNRCAWKNMIVTAAQLIPETILDNKKLLRGIDKTCKKRDFDTYAWVGNLVGAWRFKEVMPKEIFGQPTLYEFEGQMVYGPQMADNYLTSLYGDWRKLPPEEKRVSHHDFVEFDLRKSYLDR